MAPTTTSPSKTTTEIPPPPRGRNVSGRPWKKVSLKRASSVRKDVKSSWEQRQAAKRHRAEVLALQKQLSDEKRDAILLKKERQLENEKRRAENQYKALRMQTLNPDKVQTKLKAMSKKQLRQIRKTRINNKTGVVELVSPYGNK